MAAGPQGDARRGPLVSVSRTDTGDLWWAGLDDGFLPGVDLRGRAYRAYGHRGQYVIVIPARNLVVVHLVDRWDPTEYVSYQQMGTLLSMILEAAPEQP